MPILSSWFNILNNLLIMDSLIGIMKDFVSLFFTMFSFCTPWDYPINLWFSDVFRECKRGRSRRNKSSFLTHFSPVFLFSTPCERQKTLGLLLFPGGIKSEQWEEMGEIITPSKFKNSFFSGVTFINYQCLQDSCLETYQENIHNGVEGCNLSKITKFIFIALHLMKFPKLSKSFIPPKRLWIVASAS